jgi:ceramide glucosyltransferase
MHHFVSVPLWLFMLLHMAAWYSIDVGVFRAINQASPAVSSHTPYHDGPGKSGFRIHFFIAWLVRELSALPIWTFAMLGNKVSWREDGKLYKVKPDGKVVQAHSKDWIDEVAEGCFRRIRGRGSSVDRYTSVSLSDEEAT